MAAFNENGWMPGGHAVRMAVDMGINRSFVALLRSGMGKGKSAEELEEERHLVVQSRVWFCVSPQGTHPQATQSQGYRELLTS